MNNSLVLSQEDIDKAEKIGKARCEAKPLSFRFNDSNYHSNNSDRSFPHIIGALAEIAYSKAVNKPMDEEIYDHGDKTDFNGIEIKATTWDGIDPELIIKQKEYNKKSPLAYVLIRIDKDYKTGKIEFIGSISRERFDKLKYERTHKYSPNYCVKGSELAKGIAIINSEGKLELVKFS